MIDTSPTELDEARRAFLLLWQMTVPILTKQQADEEILATAFAMKQILAVCGRKTERQK